MTATFDDTIRLEELSPEPVPDFRASSGETGEPIPGVVGKKRPGIFGGKEPRPRPKPKEKGPVPKLAPHMRDKIRDFYILVGGLAQPFDPLLSETIIEQAPLCAKAVYDYAQANESFRRVIQAFLTTSMTGALIFAHIPIFLVLVSRVSNNDKTRMTAAGMMVAMKLMSEQQAEEAFANVEEPEET